MKIVNRIFRWLVFAQIFIPWLLITGISFQSCIFGADECPNPHVTFWLYKNETQNEPLQINPLNLSSQLFEPKLPLKIIIHGFRGDRDFSPNPEVRPALLQSQEVYVISVDYSRLGPLPCYYPWATYNARIVGKCLAHLLDSLIDSGIYSSEELHVIGFSLGAQIAGLTGNYVRHRLKHITGLDPASPGFMAADNMDKLDRTDADFVDVIHTDVFLYSSVEPSGHADFYPNLDNLYQRGCSFIQDGQLRNCNHFRAPAYYAESITTDRGFWAYNCGNWFDFTLQRCYGYSQIPDERMGYFVSQNASGSYFLQTNPEAPYAKGPLVNFELDVNENSTTLNKGN